MSKGPNFLFEMFESTILLKLDNTGFEFDTFATPTLSVDG